MMQTDYSRIKEEHIKGYGEWVDEYGPTLLSDRYSDRTHFVYELLQNAEDAIGWRLEQGAEFPRDAYFDLSHDALVFKHFGLPFAEQHVRAICKIGKGTKGKDLTAIGKHGIGFKSVYAYTHHPEVHSGPEHFVIDSFVRPCRVDARPTANGETQFILPFDHPDVPRETAYNEIADRLKKLGLRTLLFLRNIDSISWKLADGKSGQYLRESRFVADGVERVTLLGQDAVANEQSEQWLVFRRPVTHQGNHAGFAEIAFNLAPDEKSGEDRIATVTESPLVVFFPTEKETHFGFLIQGPYRTTPSRDNIPREDTWNDHLVSQTADMVKWALTSIRDMGLMTVGALESLVVDLQKYSPYSQTPMFCPIAEAVVDSLKSERLIPGSRGGYLQGSVACIARAEGLRSLISYEQLTEATESKAGWVSGEVTQRRTVALYSFLTKSIGVKEFDGEDFIRSLSDEFFGNRSDEWTVQFYSFLLDQHAIRRQPWFSSKAFIRLTNDNHVTPFSSAGTPNAYLPGPGHTDFPTVKHSLCEGTALQFLHQLGLKQPDPVDDVIRNVLPKYRLDQVDVDDSTYEDDIRRLLDAYSSDSQIQKEKLLAALRNTSFIMSVDIGDGVKYVSKPGEVYIATERLKTLFDQVPNVILVDDDYSCLRGEHVRDLLESCGAVRYVRPVSDYSLTPAEKSQLRKQAGHAESSGGEYLSDWTLDGLDEFLSRLPSMSSVDKCAKAKLLWEELGNLEERRGKSVFQGEYQWKYYVSHSTTFNAAFIRKLNSTAWIPDAAGNLQRPEFVLFDSLNWRPSPFLQSKIRFRPPVIDTLAKEAGIEPGVLDLLKKQGITSVAELLSRLGTADQTNDDGDTDSNVANEFGTVDDVADDMDEDTDANEDVDEADDVDDSIKGILGDTPDPSPPIDDPTGPVPAGSGAGNVSNKDGGSGARGSGSGNGKSSGQGSLRRGGKHSGVENGKSGGNRGGSAGNRQFISYVGTHPDEEEPDPDGLDRESRMALEEKAIKLILEHEPQLERTPTNNPGFDLFESDNRDQPIRWIEVKAMASDLLSRPVGLSRRQFECARERGSAYWLYVVEHADDADDAHIVSIQDPFGKARTFTFDCGWRSVADDVGNSSDD